MILIRGGRVYDPEGDTDRPALRDVLVDGDTIRSVTAPDDDLDEKRRVEAEAARGLGEVIEAGDRLVLPGFVNAHYHSYDTLAKGLIEDAPFDLWALQTQPAYYGRRSKAELRLRTLVGAMECLKGGITTVQDMCTLVPQDEDTLDVIAAAYAEVGHPRGLRAGAARRRRPRHRALPPRRPERRRAPGRHRQPARRRGGPRLRGSAGPAAARIRPVALGRRRLRPAALVRRPAGGRGGAVGSATRCRSSPTCTRRAPRPPRRAASTGGTAAR